MIHGNALIQTDLPMGQSEFELRSGMHDYLPGPILTTARNMFGLDYRSLALLRIGLGLCLLWVAFTNAWEMRAFYTDDGVLPRTALLENPAEPAGFSLYLADGSLAYVAILFSIQMILAGMLLVGYRTRLAAVGSYILLFSMHNRQPVLLFGADISLRVGLFWAMFMPLANCFSMDRLTGRTRCAKRSAYLGMAGIAFIVQLCAIYTGGALLKTGRSWLVDHSAVANALAIDAYSRPLGHWLGQFTWLTQALTVFTLYLELYGPILFILPFFSRWCRLISFILFAALQIGFGVCMTMGVFSSVMIALSLPLLPAMVWDRFAEPLGKRIAARFRGLTDWSQNWLSRASVRRGFPEPRSAMSFYARLAFVIGRESVLSILLVTMILWNISNIPGQPWRVNQSLTTMGYAIGLNQAWDMFSPDPTTVDGWFVVAGTLRNGKTVDLMSGASPATYDKPASVSGSYRSQIWMSYLTAFMYDGAPNPEPFARYLSKTWNERHSGNERLKSIDIQWMSETVWPGPVKGRPEPVQIWQQSF